MMENDLPYSPLTRKQVVNLQRQAFMAGVSAMYVQEEVPNTPEVSMAEDRAQALVNELFPQVK